MAFSLTQQSQENKYDVTIGQQAENSWELDADWDRTVRYCQTSTPHSFFFSCKFSVVLHIGPWLLQTRWPLARRDLANTVFIKTQIYWIHVPKSPKSIGLLLGEWSLYLEYGPQMSLLREETQSSHWEQQHPGIWTSWKLRTRHRDVKGCGTSLLSTKSKAEPSNGSFLQSLSPAQPCFCSTALHICRITRNVPRSLRAKSTRYGLGLSELQSSWKYWLKHCICE